MGTVATEEGRMVCAVRVACCQMSSKRLGKGRKANADDVSPAGIEPASSP
jgi:hypothetical protein